MNRQEAREAFQRDKAAHEHRGAVMPLVQTYLPEEWRYNSDLAMDAQVGMITDPSAGIPAMLTTMIDPKTYRVILAPNKAAQIIGEVKKGNWTDQTAMFPMAEFTGEVSSYGDYNENGASNVNATFPQRQAYLFQVIMEYGELELERAGLAKLNWAAEQQASAANTMAKFLNLSYFYGVAGLQNYGLLNDPGLSASLTPSTKVAGGTAWANATPNEVFSDIQALFTRLVSQSGGTIEATDRLVLAGPPGAFVALTNANSFNTTVYSLLKVAFPNIRFETAQQYAAYSASNTQGFLGGNLVQLIAETVEGQETGYASFNEKMRAHKLIPAVSSWKQKMTSGTWGTVLRMPFAVASMLGV